MSKKYSKLTSMQRAPAKNASENVVCLICLLHIFANMTNESVDANYVDPDQTAPTEVRAI